jgi:hypothetical protein
MQAVEKTSSSREPDKLKLLVMNMKSASIFGGACKKVLGMQSPKALSFSKLPHPKESPLNLKPKTRAKSIHNLLLFKFAHPKIAKS